MRFYCLLTSNWMCLKQNKKLIENMIQSTDTYASLLLIIFAVEYIEYVVVCLCSIYLVGVENMMRTSNSAILVVIDKIRNQYYTKSIADLS